MIFMSRTFVDSVKFTLMIMLLLLKHSFIHLQMMMMMKFIMAHEMFNNAFIFIILQGKMERLSNVCTYLHETFEWKFNK